jgi:hypothetical protein
MNENRSIRFDSMPDSAQAARAFGWSALVCATFAALLLLEPEGLMQSHDATALTAAGSPAGGASAAHRRTVFEARRAASIARAGWIGLASLGAP